MTKSRAASATLMKLPTGMKPVLAQLKELSPIERAEVLQGLYDRQESPQAKGLALKLRFRLIQEEAADAAARLKEEEAAAKGADDMDQTSEEPSPAADGTAIILGPSAPTDDEAVTDAAPESTGEVVPGNDAAPEDEVEMFDVPPERLPSPRTLKDLEELSGRPLLLPGSRGA
ncbi:MAG: hypothetical protein AAGA15_00485 [Pseudomonadota bacterium]